MHSFLSVNDTIILCYKLSLLLLKKRLFFYFSPGGSKLQVLMDRSTVTSCFLDCTSMQWSSSKWDLYMTVWKFA